MCRHPLCMHHSLCSCAMQDSGVKASKPNVNLKMADKILPSTSMNLGADLKRLASNLDLKDIWAVGQALGLQDDAIPMLKGEPRSSTKTYEKLLRTWMEQHAVEQDDLTKLEMLEDKLTRFGFLSRDVIEATDLIDANANIAKGKPKKQKLGLRKWFILVGLFLVSFLEVGSIRTLSLILDDLTYQFDVSTSYLAAIYGIVSGTYLVLAFLNTQLLSRFSVRQLTIFGGIVSSLGLILGSFTQTVPQVTAGLIAFGAGYIFIILPTYTCLNSYFPDRFEIATGIMTSGGSTGVMFMPWIFELILNTYGWRGALLLLGGCQVHFIAIGALLKPVKPVQTEKKPTRPKSPKGNGAGHEKVSLIKTDPTGEKERIGAKLQNHQELGVFYCKEEGRIKHHSCSNDNSESNSDILTVTPSPADLGVKKRNVDCPSRCLKKFYKISGLRIFKERPLIIIVCFQILLFSIPYATWLLFNIPNAQAKGLTDLRCAQISLAGGTANFFGRFASGFVFSKNVLPVEVWYLLANVVAAIAFFVNYIADPFWFLTILSLVFGFMMGFNIPTIFVLMKNTTGEERYQSGLVLLHLSYGVAFPFAGFIAGKIYDGTQSYNLAFCVMGGLALAAGAAVILPLLGSRFGKIMKKCACSCV